MAVTDGGLVVSARKESWSRVGLIAAKSMKRLFVNASEALDDRKNYMKREIFSDCRFRTPSRERTSMGGS
jgi:hypothetical protein